MHISSAHSQYTSRFLSVSKVEDVIEELEGKANNVQAVESTRSR